MELLHEQPLAPHGVQHLQKQRAQQLLGRDRRPPNPRVELTELGRQLRQNPVDHAADRAQGVIRRDSLLKRQIAPHPSLLPIVTTHARLRGKNYAHGRRTLMLTRHPKSGFSASC